MNPDPPHIETKGEEDAFAEIYGFPLGTHGNLVNLVTPDPRTDTSWSERAGDTPPPGHWIDTIDLHPNEGSWEWLDDPEQHPALRVSLSDEGRRLIVRGRGAVSATEQYARYMWPPETKEEDAELTGIQGRVSIGTSKPYRIPWEWLTGRLPPEMTAENTEVVHATLLDGNRIWMYLCVRGLTGTARLVTFHAGTGSFDQDPTDMFQPYVIDVISQTSQMTEIPEYHLRTRHEASIAVYNDVKNCVVIPVWSDQSFDQGNHMFLCVLPIRIYDESEIQGSVIDVSSGLPGTVLEAHVVDNAQANYDGSQANILPQERELSIFLVTPDLTGPPFIANTQRAWKTDVAAPVSATDISWSDPGGYIRIGHGDELFQAFGPLLGTYRMNPLPPSDPLTMCRHIHIFEQAVILHLIENGPSHSPVYRQLQMWQGFHHLYRDTVTQQDTLWLSEGPNIGEGYRVIIDENFSQNQGFIGGFPLNEAKVTNSSLANTVESVKTALSFPVGSSFSMMRTSPLGSDRVLILSHGVEDQGPEFDDDWSSIQSTMVLFTMWKPPTAEPTSWTLDQVLMAIDVELDETGDLPNPHPRSGATDTTVTMGGQWIDIITGRQSERNTSFRLTTPAPSEEDNDSIISDTGDLNYATAPAYETGTWPAAPSNISVPLELLSEPEEETENNNTSFIWWIAGAIAAVLLFGAGIIVVLRIKGAAETRLVLAEEAPVEPPDPATEEVEE